MRRDSEIRIGVSADIVVGTGERIAAAVNDAPVAGGRHQLLESADAAQEILREGP